MKKTRHKITFQDDRDAAACALAKLGMGTRAITEETGLTPCQVTYRLSKLKRLEKQEHGYRVAWRNGTSEEFRIVRSDLEKILTVEIQQSVTPRLIERQNGKVKK